MSLEKLAVIFIIIVLPISIVLKAYTNSQNKTIELQLYYDQKLNNSTADALKAYQLNAFNETTSNLATSKMKNINAAANAFFTSLSANFDMQGYSKENLQDFVPALVFTMYDGYYMYSKYINTLTEDDYFSPEEAQAAQALGLDVKPSKYQNDENASNPIYGLKPFVSYSCGYKNYPQNGDSFVISYTLDNYITIQGIINGEYINDSGYLIDINKIPKNSIKMDNKTLTYRGVEIGPENCLEEYVGTRLYKYHKENGVKFYYDDQYVDGNGNVSPKWFNLLNGTKIYINNKSFSLDSDDSAYHYYLEAYAFTQRITQAHSTTSKDIFGKSCYGLSNLKVLKCDEADYLKQSNKDQNIFDIDNIELQSSNFNQHRLAVIRYTIEKNLSIAIKNYNHYAPTVQADFEMPEFKETEWDKIQNNITLISYLQGMPIGGKIYNGCSVIANTENDEVITEDSIYIADRQMGTNYYKPTYTKFNQVAFPNGATGVLSVDLKRRSIEDTNSVQDDYYYPKFYYADYGSVVNSDENANINADNTDISNNNYAYNGNIYKYMEENANPAVAKAYFTALGRERHCSYKIQNYNRRIGDLNSDEIVDREDYKILMNHFLHDLELTDLQKQLGDVNLDGRITFADVNALGDRVFPGEYAKGDVNGDGEINEDDVTILARYNAEWNGYRTFTERQFRAADMNNDNELDFIDIILLASELE